MPGHSRPKRRRALPGIHVLTSPHPKDVDGRDKPGHDEGGP